MMERREFLKRTLLAASAAGIPGLAPRLLRAEGCPPTDMPRTLVNFMLHGGADFRFLFMPAPSHPFPGVVDALWTARRALYNSDYASYTQMFDAEYLLAQDPRTGLAFGIHNSAGWLHAEFQAGRAAVVANAFCSRNRRHDQSILNADAGEPDLDQLIFDRSGWGGRLVEQIGNGANAVELGNSVSVFAKGSDPGARMAQVVHAQDMRNMSLAGTSAEQGLGSRRNVLARALNAWYEGRGTELQQEKSPAWPYQPFISHRAAIQQFGSLIDQRLSQCRAMPEALEALALPGGLDQQCRNLFDACQLPDVLNLRILSMSLGGWDSHDNQAAEISANLGAVFGADGGLGTVVPLLDTLPYAEVPVRERLVFFFASDFGRQLRANGTAGTDHGRGTYSILLGTAIRGGIYGEPFPLAEALPDGEGRTPLTTQGADITGLTSTQKILANACEWVTPGSAAGVFPDAAMADIEEPGLLDTLFTTG